MIKERIDNIKKYFSKIELIDGILIVRVIFNDKWGIIRKNESSIKIVKDDEVKNGYMYWAKDGEVTLDDIFDYIEETVKYNEINEMKMKLLKDKIHELSNIFAEEDLKTLQTLKFTYKKNKKNKKNDTLKIEEVKGEEIDGDEQNNNVTEIEENKSEIQ